MANKKKKTKFGAQDRDEKFITQWRDATESIQRRAAKRGVDLKDIPIVRRVIYDEI